MAKSQIINPMEEHQKLAALHQPHNLFVVDELLLVDCDAFTATVSLGMKNPAGVLTPVLTVKMSLPFALQLSEAIASKVAEKKKDLIAELTDFTNRL